ncbi:MAG TPA: lectin, partial [Lysobacter sp.]
AAGAAGPGEAAAGEPVPSRDDGAGPARADGYGGLRFGMSADEARKAWNGTLKGDDVKPDNCAYLSPAGAARGPYLMFEQGRFVRYDIHQADAIAPGGGRVGLTADDIRRLYAGRVEERPHEYVAGGKYLRVADAASRRATLFEIDERGRVTTWRVGQAPQVDYVEGCS